MCRVDNVRMMVMRNLKVKIMIIIMTSVCLTQVKNRTKQRSNLESGDAF